MKYLESNGQLGRLSMEHTGPLHGRQSSNSALCFPLESLLLALNRTRVDYFSLDVEGFELDVLRSLPLERLDIDVISVEFLHAREPATEYRRLLADYDYTLYDTVKSMDFVFVKKPLLDAERRDDLVDIDIGKTRTSVARTKQLQKQLLLKKKVVNNNVNIIYE